MSGTGPDAGSAGAILRKAREARGLTQGKAAEQLRLPVTTIAAMEEERFDELGPAVFARGHLRKYAGLVGADADSVLAAHGRDYSGSAEATLIPPASAHKRVEGRGGWRQPLLALAGILLLAAIAAGGWWAWQQYGARELPSTPEAVEAPALVPSSPAGDIAPAAEDIEPVAPGSDEVGEAAPPPPEPVSGGAPQAAGALLQLAFSDACWLEVYAASGERLAYDLVPAGEVRSFPGPAPWRLVLGNARAVRLSLDGTDIALPGAFVVQNTASIRIDGSGAIERAVLQSRQVS